jgi:hypothetical protein
MKEYLYDIQAGAMLPLVQSSISGGVVAVFFLVIGYALRWRSPWVVAGLAGVVVLAGVWFFLGGRWLSLSDERGSSAAPVMEADSYQAEAPQEVRVRLEHIKPDGHYQEEIYTLPGSPEQLKALATGLLEDNFPFTERSWCGSGRPFSVDGFRRLRSEMLRRGLLELINGKDARQGFKLTDNGRAALGGFLGISPSPSGSDVRGLHVSA